MDGLLLIDKETGCTSHDVVQAARRALGQRKIGHCGTLDPGATGLLVLTLGRATRLTRFLINAPKTYVGRIRFGISTDTYDAAGQVVDERPVDGLEPAAVEAAMGELEGRRLQAAPPFSAKKHRGVKYYEMARRGEEVPEAKKEITVFEFRPSAPPAADSVEFRLACSSGTYVRSLAHELGEALGCGAHLAELRRLKVGPFDVETALPQAELAAAGPEQLGEEWVEFHSIPLPFGDLTADQQQERRITHGQTVLFRRLECGEGDWVKLLNRRRELIAVGTVVERIGESGAGVVQPRIVFR